jgi:hypothetical protein
MVMEFKKVDKCLYVTKCEWENQEGKTVETLGNQYKNEALYMEIIQSGSNFD